MNARSTFQKARHSSVRESWPNEKTFDSEVFSRRNSNPLPPFRVRSKYFRVLLVLGGEFSHGVNKSYSRKTDILLGIINLAHRSVPSIRHFNRGNLWFIAGHARTKRGGVFLSIQHNWCVYGAISSIFTFNIAVNIWQWVADLSICWPQLFSPIPLFLLTQYHQ